MERERRRSNVSDAIFLEDRRFDQENILAHFGWNSITVSQAAAVLSALSTDSKTTHKQISSQLKQDVFGRYPQVKYGFRSADIPARFFWKRFKKVIPDEIERSRVMRAVKETHTALPGNAERETGLQPAEYASLVLIAKGRTNKKIAKLFGVSTITVKNQNTSLFRKLSGPAGRENISIEKRESAIIYAIRKGLIPRSILHHIPEYHQTGKLKRLSYRHMDVVRLIVKGWTNKEIALALGIVDDTVKNHLTEIFRRLSDDGQEIDRYQLQLLYILDRLRHHKAVFGRKRELPEKHSRLPRRAIIFRS